MVVVNSAIARLFPGQLKCHVMKGWKLDRARSIRHLVYGSRQSSLQDSPQASFLLSTSSSNSSCQRSTFLMTIVDAARIASSVKQCCIILRVAACSATSRMLKTVFSVCRLGWPCKICYDEHWTCCLYISAKASAWQNITVFGAIRTRSP